MVGVHGFTRQAFLAAVVLTFCIYGYISFRSNVGIKVSMETGGASSTPATITSTANVIKKGFQSKSEYTVNSELLLATPSSDTARQEQSLQKFCVNLTENLIDSFRKTDVIYRTLLANCLTEDVCRNHCLNLDKRYALFIRDSCYCYDVAWPLKFVESHRCIYNFTRKELDDANITIPHGLLMRTTSEDGESNWTIWMSLQELNIRVRYHQCERRHNTPHSCEPEFVREKYNHTETDRNQTLIRMASRFIGCYSGFSLLNRLQASNYKPANLGPPGYEECLSICRSHGSSYAVITPNTKGSRACYCSDTLALSQPADTCNSGVGVIVLWIPDDPPKLQFEAARVKKGKVLVVGRYRSGSSMTQSFFNRYPNSLALFEPEKTRFNEDRTFDIATTFSQVLGAFYRCDIDQLPPQYFSWLYLKWNELMLKKRGATENTIDLVYNCSIAKPDVDCGSLLKEVCDESDFLNAKTIQFLDPQTVKKFISQNPDVNVVHLVRDPRALLAAQRAFNGIDTSEMVCSNMVEMGKLVQEMQQLGYSNVYEVFYEELATNPSLYGAKLYRDMDIDMPKAVADFLARKEYKNGTIPVEAKEVVVADPEKHVYGFLSRYSLKTILSVDKDCRDVYLQWPDHYSTFWSLYTTHRSEVMKYSSVKNKTILKYYFDNIDSNPPV